MVYVLYDVPIFIDIFIAYDYVTVHIYDEGFNQSLKGMTMPNSLYTPHFWVAVCSSKVSA